VYHKGRKSVTPAAGLVVRKRDLGAVVPRWDFGPILHPTIETIVQTMVRRGKFYIDRTLLIAFDVAAQTCPA
jgi:hypothetical protein